MIADDPFSFRHIFNRSMAYGAVVFLLLCYSPLQELFGAPVTAERLREAAGSMGGLVPVAMAVSAVVAGLVRWLLFLYFSAGHVLAPAAYSAGGACRCST